VLVDLEDFEGRVSLIANQVFDRFQKKDMDNEKRQYFNLESRLCSLTVSESPTSICDKTWKSYKKMYMSNDTTIIHFFSGLDNLTKKKANYFLRFLGNDKPTNILNNNDFLSIKLPLNDYIKRKVIEYKEKIKKSFTILSNCNEDCTTIDSQEGFELAMIVFHYIAAMTGPSNEAVESDWVRDRMSADIAKSSWGYSNSDLTRLMKEVFSNTASRILQMRFTTDSKCNDGNNCKGYKCFQKTEGGGNAYVEARSTIGNENFILQKKNGKGDVYSELTITDFCNALENRDLATTTGNSNEYCTFVLYSQGGPTEEQQQHMKNNTCNLPSNDSE
jgi:hypothetical protein